jgi:hypothetical protein
MKIGVLVDGQAEYYSLPLMLERVSTRATVLKPLYCDMQPFASPAQIAHRAMKTIPIFLRRGVSRVVVLIDKETRQDCTPCIAREIEQELAKRLSQLAPDVHVCVVLKVSSFENWLVADPFAFLNLRGAFRYRNRIQKAVEPNKADSVDALTLLRRCARKGSFDKIKDAKAICSNLDPLRAAKNSRSFRRFLRALEHPVYSDQSKRPCE